MQISLSWLNDYVKLQGHSPAEIAATLTSLGLEVEAINVVSPIQGRVVAGEILSATPIPDTDHLQVCQVTIGADSPLTIVCGAANARAGIRVAVATAGAELPGGLKIKESTIRGQKSQGMLCSEEELGIASSSEGILELLGQVALGSSIAEALGLLDTVLTLSVTPNRGDCLSHIGIARELASKLGLTLLLPEALALPSGSSKLKIQVEHDEDCNRFVALELRGLQAQSSPMWLRRRLEAVGLRSLNLTVDVTNYVMLEYGQPLHAYDAAKLSGETLQVRRALSSESLVTLDGVNRALSPEDIVIADQAQPIGLAGIMGGQRTAVSSTTTAIVLEAASFDPRRIRKTAKRLSLHTDASHRFERGIDTVNIQTVLARAAALMQQCGLELMLTPPSDYYPSVAPSAKIALRMSRARQITGLMLLTQDECIAALKSLGFSCLDKTEGRMLFAVPSHRHDVSREIDLIEELARVIGYDKIPAKMPLLELGQGHEDPYIAFADRSRVALAHLGLCETISFPFVSSRDLEHLQLSATHPLRQVVALANPLAEDQSFLQPTILPNLLKALVHNRRHGRPGTRLFEVARCFRSAVGTSVEGLGYMQTQGRHISGRGRDDKRPLERTLVAAIFDQPFHSKNWHADAAAASFYHVKAVLTELARVLGIPPLSFSALPAASFPWLVPGLSAAIHCQGVDLGYCGELHPELVLGYELNLSEAPLVFELDLEGLYGAYCTPRQVQTSTQKFPPVTRDIALVVDRGMTHAELSEALQTFPKKKHLSASQLFDVYTGPNLGADKKSMAYALSFVSADRTLKDEEVEQELQALVQWLKDKAQAELR